MREAFPPMHTRFRRRNPSGDGLATLGGLRRGADKSAEHARGRAGGVSKARALRAVLGGDRTRCGQGASQGVSCRTSRSKSRLRETARMKGSALRGCAESGEGDVWRY